MLGNFSTRGKGVEEQVLHLKAIHGMRVFIGALLGYGITKEEISTMLKENPAKLMWLDEEPS